MTTAGTLPTQMGTAGLLDGRLLRDEIVAALAAEHPDATMGTVLVTDDEPSRRAMAAKHRHAARAGIRIVAVDLPTTVGQTKLDSAVSALADDPDVDGIFVQLPLPDHLDAARVIDLVPAPRDIDGLRPDSPYLPAMTMAVLQLLERGGIAVDGRRVAVVGDSPYLAAPLARALTGRADVRRVDASAPDLAEVCRGADIIVSAADRTGLITGDHLRPGATLVDANVPNGVGPVTIACLLQHTARAARVGH